MRVAEGWLVQPLSEIARVTSGGTPRREKAEYWLGGDVPWIRTTEVQNCVLFPEDTKEYISELGVANSSAKLVPAGTILLAMIGQGKTRGQVALLKFEATINQNCAAIILDEQSSPEFYFNYLRSRYASIRGLSNSAGQSNLSGALVKSIRVPVPPIAEQRKIARILSTWDDAIATTEQLLANSEQQKKALMQQLLTGKKRLPGFEGEWKKVELGEILDYRQPTPYLVESTEYSEEYATPVLTAGKTFVLGYTNEHFGIYDNNLPVIIFDDFTTASRLVDFPFKVKSSAMKLLTARSGYSMKYIYEAMQLLRFVVGGHQRHWISIFSNLVIPVPSTEEQNAIARVLEAADIEIEIYQGRLQCFKQEKKALMQQLLTGKRRVKVDEEQSDAVPA